MSNPFDDDDQLDRLLQNTFRGRPGTGEVRPSLADVRRRARRRHHRRVGGIVGATALAGLGGTAVLASRSPGTPSADSLDPTPSTTLVSIATTMCLPAGSPDFVATTTTSIAPTTTTIEPNATSTTSADVTATTPYPQTTIAFVDEEGCVPTSPVFRCWGPLGSDDEEYSYFAYCDYGAAPTDDGAFPTTTADVFPDTTVRVGGSAITGTTVMATTTTSPSTTSPSTT